MVEMLFCSSLVAYVGAGEQIALTPRKVSIMNTSTGSIIKDLAFPTSVLAVKINWQRLVVVLERRTYVHAIKNLSCLSVLDTPANPKGTCALTAPPNDGAYGGSGGPNLLALPASETVGTVRVYDLTMETANVRCEVNAHKACVSVMAWNHNGSLLATASLKGTVIRVHQLPAAGTVFTLRRGSYTAVIHSMAFSPGGYDPELLCVSSSHGTVHIFKLAAPDRHLPGTAASMAAQLLASMVKVSLTDVVDPIRSSTTIHLPVHNVSSISALNPARTSSEGVEGPQSLTGQMSEDEGPQTSTSPRGAEAVRSSPSSALSLVVATGQGMTYEYLLEDVGAHNGGPRHSLVGVWKFGGQASGSSSPVQP